jgi:GNAT superfamily N-acetyltransferase
VDPRSVDTSELAQRIAAATRDGYRLATLGELLAVGKQRELHRLFMRADADAPHLTAASAVSFGTWRRFVLDGPILDRDASAIALHGEEPVALCWLNVDRASARAVHEFIGTLPAHRHRGLGHLTKLAALSWAARQGIRHVGTANDSGNRDILALNKHLGYRRLADAYLYLA